MKSQKIRVPNLIFISLSLGVIFWVLDSFIDSLLSHEGTILTYMFDPSPNEIYIRFFVVFLFIIFGLFGERALGRQRQMEHELKESEERFRILYESAPLGYQSLDENGHIIKVNKAWLDLLGYVEEEVVGKWFGDFLIPSQIDFFKKQFPVFKARREIHEIEFDVIRKDKTVITVSLDGTVAHLGENYFKQTHFIMHNVTEQKRAAQALRESKERYQNLFDNAMVGLFRTRIEDGKVLESNDRLAQMFGYRNKEQFIAEFYFAPHYVDPGTRERMLREIRKQGEVRNFEAHFSRCDGSRFWALYTARIFPEKGYIEGMAADITERKNAEEAVHESEARYRLHFENTGDMIFTFDRELRIISISPSVLGILGYEPEELIGRKIHELNVIPESQREQYFRDTERALAGDNPPLLGCEITAKDGSRKYIEISSTSLIRDGQVMAVTCIARDRTERKRASEKISELNKQIDFILGTTGIHIDIIDSQFNIRHIDSAWSEVYGDPAGKKCYDYFMGRNEVCPGCGVAKALETKSMVVSEETLVKEGNRIIQVTSLPFEDKNGEWLVAEVNVDITERRKIENDLWIKDRAIASSINALALANLEGKVTYVNDAFVRMWGYDAEESLNIPSTSFSYDTSKIPMMIDAITTKGYFIGESIAKRKDGSLFNIQISANLVTNASGQPLAMLAAFVDITPRKRAEAALLESEKTSRVLLNAAGEGILLLDNKGTILSINDLIAQDLDRASGELIGANIYELLPPELATIRKKYADQVFQTGMAASLEDEYGGRWIESNITPIADKQGPISRVAVFARDITYRKRAEEALRQNETKYRELADSLPQVVFEIDWQGNVKYINKNGFETFGVPPGNFDHLNMFQFISPDDHKRVRENMEKRRQGFESTENEYTAIRADGSAFPVAIHSTPIIQEGKVVGLRGFLINITESRKIREALRERERFLQTVFDGIQDGIDVLDKKMNIIRTNKAMECRYPDRIPLVGKKCYEAFHSRKEPCQICPVARAVETRTPQMEEVPLSGQSETPAWLEIYAFPILDGSGNCTGVIEYSRDITERRLAEKALKESENRYRELLESVTDYIYMVTVENGHVIKTIHGPGCTAVTGYTPEEYDSNPLLWHKMIYEDDRAAVEERANLALAGKDVPPLEHRLIHKDGSIRWVKNTSVARRDEKGNVVSYDGLISDITGRKRAEEALCESRERYKNLYNDAQVGLYRTSVSDGRVIECNERFAQIFGYDNRQEFIAEFLFSKHYVDAGTRERLIAELYEKGEVRNYTARFFKRDGSIDWVSYSARINPQEGYIEGAAIDITEQKTAEQALCASESRYKLHFEHVNDVIFSIDKDYRLSNASPSVKNLLGYNPEELIGRTIFELNILPPEKAEKALADINAVFSGQRIEAVEYEFRVKDGTMKSVEISAAPLYEDGQIIEIICIARDVTERKRAEDALRESEEKYRSIVENTTDMIMLTSSDGSISYVSPKCREVVGYTQDDLRNRQSWVIHPDDLARVKVLHQQALQGLPGSNHEYRIITKDGQTKYISHSWSPMFKNDKLEVIVSIVRDITEQKKAEIAIRESEEKFRAVFETAEDSIFIKDRDSKYASANPSMGRLLGIPAVQIIGKTDDELYGEEVGNHCREIDRQVLDGKIIQEENMKPIRGELRIFNVIEVPMRNPQGEIIGLCGIARDITENKRMEEELARAEKLESIGVLAGGIAHDFNNLLTAILGNVSLVMMDTEEESEIFKRLSKAEKAIVRAQDLTHQLLTFSKGGAPIKKTATIIELIRETAEFALRGANVRCEFNLPDGLYPVDIDAGQISQVINNLVINGCQAMPNGGIITITAQNANTSEEHSIPIRSGKCIKISISDKGGGIPAQLLPRIFDPFFTTKQKGNGLGLATTYSIIKKHDGYIEAKSAVGVGTTFNIYLPASEKTPVTIRNDNRKPVHGHGNILIMDDEEDVRTVVGVALTSLGYSVDYTKDGAEAIELFKKALESNKPFDAVIMDLTIPGGMGGKETMDRLREIDPRVKAIVSSGYSNDPILADYAKYGFKGFVPKPYKVWELSQVLAEVLGYSPESTKAPVNL